MKKSMYVILAMLFVACQSMLVMAAKVQTETVDLTLKSGRPVKINVWYPHGTCAVPEQKQLCLADTAIIDKAVVLSHGAMGSAGEYSWVGESLATAGFVVVGVNHFGESWVYGQNAVNPVTTAYIWQRPQDISALLDNLTTQDIFQKKVNWSNVIAIGHSSGGQTAAMLAGATFDLMQLGNFCHSPASKDDRTCFYGKNSANAPEEFQKAFRASQKDARVKLAVMLDPALGLAVKPESLRAIKIPVLIVGAKNNDFLPWKNHGEIYAAGISTSTVKLLKGQEGHFAFLNPCQHQFKAADVSLCEDRAGVDRNAVHKEVNKYILKFVRKNKAALANK